MTTKRTTTALLLALGLLTAGCGGGGGGGDDDVASVSGDDGEEQAQGDADEDEEAELIQWAECMRDQGIDIPDPTRDADGNLVLDGPGIHIGSGEVGIGAGPQDGDKDDEGGGDEPPISPEEMDAATEECGPPPALGGADMSEEDRAKMEADALEFAECMRDEGVEDFPDPDFSGEGPGGAPQTRRDGPEEGDGPGEAPQERVVLGPFGEIDLNDPQTKAAFEACQGVIGVPEGGPGGPGAPAGPAGPAGGGSSET